MKRVFVVAALAVIVTAASGVISACASSDAKSASSASPTTAGTPSASTGTSPAPATPSASAGTSPAPANPSASAEASPAPANPAAPAGALAAPAGASAAPAAPAAAPVKTAWEGDGGKGIRIAVLQPVGKGLRDDEAWIPALIQGSLTGDFQRNSAMTVTDRQNLDAILGEQTFSTSGNFSDDDYLKIGQMTSAQYVLTGSIQRLPAGYMLDLGITDASSGERKASFPPKMCTLQDLTELGVIKEATIDLLEQMGVTLTQTTLTQLRSVKPASSGAEVSLAKGVVAQRGGSTIAALVNFYEANELDPTLSEAINRMTTIGDDLQSGNMGENVRNDIQRRQAWIDLLTQAENYFNEHLPYELIYDPNLVEGDTDYDKNTVPVSFTVLSKPTSAFKVINRILAGLIATEKAVTWKLAGWPMTSKVFTNDGGATSLRIYGNSIDSSKGKDMNLNCMLINNQGKVIGIAKQTVTNPIGFHTPDGGWNYDYSILNVAPSYGRDWYGRPDQKFPQTVVFSGVSANDLTPDMTISIEVNGRDAQTATRTGYIKISSGNTTWYTGGDLLQTLLNMDRELYKSLEMGDITSAELAEGRRKERYSSNR